MAVVSALIVRKDPSGPTRERDAMPTAADGRPGGARIAREGTWRVGDLLVDAGRRTVQRDDRPLPISGLSLDVLLALIESAPNLVGNDELMDRVWGNVVVSPETLTQRIKLLRDALGDDPRRPRYIQGVRGRGYRLLPVPEQHSVDVVQPVATAGVQGAHESPTAAKKAAVAATPPLRRLPLPVLLGAPALVAIALLAWWAMHTTSEPPGLVREAGDAVAVMPFSNLDESEPGAVLADGMAEALLHRLATLDGVTVISRYSSFAASGAGLAPARIGELLHARYLLEGSVQSGSGRLRIRTALTDVTDGRQLWSLQFDRDPDDLLAVQDEIAAKVAQTFEATAQPVVPAMLGAGTTNSAAQLAYLQGSALADRMVVAELDRALLRLEEATRIDPAFAAAHAAAAAALLTRDELRDDQRLRQAEGTLREAEKHVMLALAADASNGEALVVRARIAARRGEFQAAQRDFRAALDARPNDVAAHLEYARFLFYGIDPVEQPASAEFARRIAQRHALALQHCDHAAELDPLSPSVQLVRGQMALHLGNFEEATAHLQSSLRLDPNFPPSLGRLGQLHWLGGRLADAVVYAERAIAIDPAAEQIRRMLSQYHVELDDVAAANRVLAAGGPELADGALAVMLHERRWREAAEIALADSQRQPRTYDRDLASFALLEWARRSPADADRILAMLQGRIAWKQIGQERVIHHSSRFATLAAAELLIARGDVTNGHELIDEVVSAIEADHVARQDPSLVVPVREDRRALALALALRGDTTGALQQLEELVGRGNLRHLWYDIDIQPAFAELRRDPRFEVLLREYRAHVQRERDKLARSLAPDDEPGH